MALAALTAAALAVVALAVIVVALPIMLLEIILRALAALFVATGVWDVTSPDVPAWYPRLRILLTAVVAGLLAVSAAVAAMG